MSLLQAYRGGYNSRRGWWVADEYAEQLPLIWPGFRAYLAAKTLPGFG